MRAINRYHKWVEWSDEDGAYIGTCPDLITGIHGDDPVQVYQELCEVIADVIDDFETRGRPLPDPRVIPVLQAKPRAAASPGTCRLRPSPDGSTYWWNSTG